MTNPNNAIGVNAAYGTRTSVNAMNDLAQIVSGRGILSGWAVVPKSGMTVSAGGVAGTRDVAIGEDNLGNRICLNNRLASSVDVTIPAASVSSARYDAIVVYANNPAQAANTTPDAPGVCGIIVASGSASGVSDAQIRSAITADGGTGSTAYYAVLAQVYVGAGSTVITSANISQSKISLEPGEDSITTEKIADGAITADKVASSVEVGEVVFEYIQASDSSADTTQEFSLDWSKYSKFIVEVDYVTSDTSTRYDELNFRDANETATSVKRAGVQMDNNTTVTGYRQDSTNGSGGSVHAYGAGDGHLYMVITSAMLGGDRVVWADSSARFEGRNSFYWNHLNGQYIDAVKAIIDTRSWGAGSFIRAVGYR